MLRRDHCCFSFAWIDHDNFGFVGVAQNALPQDGVSSAEVRADQHDYVRLFEILVRERRRVEAEGLFVGGGGRGHALARVAVAMDDAYAEFGEAAEEGHFFGNDLTSANVG